MSDTKRLAHLFPELAFALGTALREAGFVDAADGVASLVVTDGVASSSTAELAFEGELDPTGTREVSGHSGRVAFFAYLSGDKVVRLSLQNLGTLRPVLRKICARHEEFDWDAYYARG